MTRLALLLPLIAGCHYYAEGDPEPGGDSGDLTDAERVEALFNQEVLPIVEADCGACHGGELNFIDFLAPAPPDLPTVYSRVLDWPALVNLDEPDASRILTKGEHDGPGWSDDDQRAILRWIDYAGRNL